MEQVKNERVEAAAQLMVEGMTELFFSARWEKPLDPSLIGAYDRCLALNAHLSGDEKAHAFDLAEKRFAQICRAYRDKYMRFDAERRDFVPLKAGQSYA